jgi:leucyl-tRNA synthetase
VQVKGKVRGRISVPADATDEQIVEIALAEKNVAREVGGKAIKRAIVIPKRLVNLIV